MEIQPVEMAIMPEYPDKYAKEAQQTLAKSFPRRWIGAPLAVGLLSAALAMGASGCVVPESFATLGDNVQAPSGLKNLSLDERIIPSGVVVPIFEYGRGTGSIGCMSISAPVFLSEEEAFAILAATFAEAGLTLSSTHLALENASIPATHIYANSSGSTDSSITLTQGVLSVDGVLELGQSVSIEFVSTKDLDVWQGGPAGWSTVQTYDLIGIARALATNNPGLIVFYDPVVYPQGLEYIERLPDESAFDYQGRSLAIRSESEREAREQAEALLREQALAFIDWLTVSGTS